MALSVNGQVAPNGIVHGGLITETQVNAYNNALSVVAGSTFYDAEANIADHNEVLYDTNVRPYLDMTLKGWGECGTIYAR